MTYRILNAGDSQAKKVSKALANPSAKKILDYLSEIEKASESDFVKNLGMKESTVNYTVKLLMDSGLITIYGSKYSAKGKDMKYYSVSNEPIVIVPNQSLIAQLGMLLPALLAIVVFAGLLPFLGMGDTADALDSMAKDPRIAAAPMAAEMQIMDEAIDEDVAEPASTAEVLQAQSQSPQSDSHSLLYMLYGGLIVFGLVAITALILYFYKR